MTIINAKLNDSYGQPINGYIQVKLDYLVVNNVTNESYLPVAAKIPLVNGDASFNLEPSELAQVTYLFEVHETVSSLVGGAVVISDVLRWSFRAKVPDVASPVELYDLVTNTGITHDVMDASLSAIVRRLYLSEDFWGRFQQQVVTPKGAYSATTYYKRGNLVSFDGGSYVYVNNTSDVGKHPSNSTYWQQLAARGSTGAGTSGNPAPYDATGWLNQNDAPSRGAVRDLAEGLATKAEVNSKVAASGASLASPTLSSAIPPITDNSSKIVSTSWIQALVAEVKKAVNPIGTVNSYAGTSAPTGWLLCDGRAVSRTTYAALFAVIGTTYGNNTGTDFKLPDLRGRVITMLDSTPTQPDSQTRLGKAWSNTVGGSGGTSNETLTTTQIPSHRHQQVVLANDGGNIPNAKTDFTVDSNTASAYLQGIQTEAEGGGQAHNNVQPSLCMYYVIYAGV